MASQRKTHLCMVGQACAQFVQLQMWEPQMGEATLMQGLGVLTCAREPGGDGGLTVALRPVRLPKGPALRPAP